VIIKGRKNVTGLVVIIRNHIKGIFAVTPYYGVVILEKEYIVYHMI
jgi:hypothetical protein